VNSKHGKSEETVKVGPH